MIETARLILRRWTDADRPVFHAHCSDPEVMRYLGPRQTRAETDAALDRQNGYIESHGYGFWAVERRDDGVLLGFCGLKPGAPATPIADDVEIGWRFGSAHWGLGYAREAAEASLAWGWRNTDAPSIAAITVAANGRSWGLMERLGMSRVEGGDFDHPAVPDGSPLKRHIIYRIARPA
jgi:RimJ/RimL family protein N-acetyltransferase